MRILDKGVRSLSALLASLLLAAATVHAQHYPAKPVRLIVGYAAGGGTDTVARVIAQALSEDLGRQVIVDNRPGAGGNIATDFAVQASPDGYTLLMGNVGPMTVNPHLYKLSFDPLRDLSPITLIAAAPLLVVVHPSLPVSSLRELIALAKRRPGAMNYSSAGVGSSNHLAGALFGMVAGVEVVHVPYKGAAPAVIDLLAGNVELSFQTIPSVGAQLKAGRLKALAVTSARRSTLFPDLPTSAEAGLGDLEVSAWYGLLAPAGTPRPIIDRVHQATASALKNRRVVERLTAQGAEPAGTMPNAFGAFMRSETDKWAKVVKASGMKAD